MPSVVLQILFFFIAGGGIIGILLLVSDREEQTPSPTPFSEEKSELSLPHAEEPISRAESAVLPTIGKQLFQIFGSAFKQPRDIFVYTQGIVGKIRGQVQTSVLSKTFERDSETRFSLNDVDPTPETKVFTKRVAPRAKQAPKLVQKLQNQFEERSEGEGDRSSDSEEEFWLGILRQNPHVAHPYKKLGEIYLKRGDFKEAQASLSFALTKDPNDEEAATLLAEVKEKRGSKKSQD